ncbi:alpha/beta fold hydrolase [Nocardioides speluncae]|uniref:alpha/beta fold hydrolase n=1 Tax=Nocardioides speluncae TaxID=2670337 RepID=UPI000D6900C5|nr:alpha/beta hydrolase [Nocardioides speluncae]
MAELVNLPPHERRGTGQPVVLVHGIGSRWQVFDPILDLVARRHDVLAVDLPGFGVRPSDPSVTPGPVGYAEWVAKFCAEQGIDRPHVVGNSMGGGIALEMGRRGTAGRVTAFSPVGFWGRPGARWAQAMVTTLRTTAKYGGPLTGPALAFGPTRAALAATCYGRPSQLSKEALQLDVDGLARATSFEDARRSFAGYDLTSGADLGHLTDIPVTVAWGTRDVLLTYRTQSRRARAALPTARHLDLPGCGHIPFNDDPALCARVIIEEQA